MTQKYIRRFSKATQSLTGFLCAAAAIPSFCAEAAAQSASVGENGGIRFTVAAAIIGIICAALITALSICSAKAKNQSEELEAAKAEVDRANNIKSRLLAEIMHEIRTPASTILGMNEMILRESDDAGISQYALNIKSAGETLLSILTDILDLSKLEAGHLRINESEYEPQPLLCELISMAELTAREKNLILEYDLDPNIPKKLYGDGLRIKQIISNLLCNALKYTDKGSVRLSIRTEPSKNEGFTALLISVTDTGRGIREEDRERIFSAFERLDESPDRHIDGTGLGLPITKAILELMNSSLEFTSEYGKGSCFGFRLEQRICSDEKLGSVRLSRVSERHSYSYHAGFTAPDAEILIVDDNEMNSELIKNLLSETQIKTATAHCGAECLEAVRNKRYDIILLDNMMPDINGTEILAKIRGGSSPCRNSAIIVLTADSESGAKEKYLAAGFDDYLSKPVEVSLLENAVRRFLPPDKLVEACGGKQIIAATGLKYSGENEQAYRKMLEIYRELGSSTLEKLEHFYSDGDLGNYEILIHSLKSTSLGIGAEALSSKAKALESAAKDNDTEFVQKNHIGAMLDYKAVLEEIDGLLCERSDKPSPVEKARTELSKEDYLAALKSLRLMIEDFNTDEAERLLKRLSESSCGDYDVSGSADKLLELLGSYHWEEAAEFAASLEKQEKN